jgi:hypothetical protein
VGPLRDLWDRDLDKFWVGSSIVPVWGPAVVGALGCCWDRLRRFEGRAGVMGVDDSWVGEERSMTSEGMLREDRLNEAFGRGGVVGSTEGLSVVGFGGPT